MSSQQFTPKTFTRHQPSNSEAMATTSDKIGYVSPCLYQEISQTPSSPGKLVQKYMEHTDIHPSPRKHRSMSYSSQDLLNASSLKATALVAPYIGGDDSLLEQRAKAKVDSTHVFKSEQPSGKWKTLVETKDHLLAQKTHLIERQKLTISHLQAQLTDLEARNALHLSATLHGEGQSVVHARLRELESHNAALQAELAGIQSGSKETEQLSQKLNAKEYELHQKTMEFSSSTDELVAENNALIKQVGKMKAFLKELEQKLQTTSVKNKELSEHIVKLNGYFENMPTMEEYQAMKEHNENINQQCSSLRAQLSNAEALLEETKSKLKEKESDCESLDSQCGDLLRQLQELRSDSGQALVHKLQEEKIKMNKECKRLQKLLFESEKHTQSELEAMRLRHKNRFVEATADLRAKHKAVVKRSKALEAQLLRNTEAMMAVNEELQVNQGAVTQLKTSMKEVLAQNQELVEKNISLQEATSEAVASSETSVKSRQLAIELTQAVVDFKSLVDLSSSLVEGNASLMLNSRDYDEDEEPSGAALVSVTDLAFSDSPDSQLEQVKRLRTEVNSLRELVSEQLAIQVSSACHIQ